MDRKEKKLHGLCPVPLPSVRGWEMKNYMLCYICNVLNCIIKKIINFQDPENFKSVDIGPSPVLIHFKLIFFPMNMLLKSVCLEIFKTNL